MIFFVAPEVSVSSYYLNKQVIHCKISTALDSGGNYFLRHQDFHWQLVSEQPIWENLSFLLSWADSFALTHTLKTGGSDARANKDEPWDERSVCRSVQLSGPGS